MEMSFQEYVNQLFDSEVNLYDLSDEDLDLLQKDYQTIIYKGEGE